MKAVALEVYSKHIQTTCNEHKLIVVTACLSMLIEYKIKSPASFVTSAKS